MIQIPSLPLLFSPLHISPYTSAVVNKFNNNQYHLPMAASFPTSTLAAATATTFSSWRWYGRRTMVGLPVICCSLSLCNPTFTNLNLDEAYKQCGKICKHYAKTFYLGTMLMTPERRRAIWAVYVWCRRTDDLVDGPNHSYVTSTALDCWESRLLSIFQNKPLDIFDAALVDTINNFNINIQPFKDMIEGMKMDINKSRYKNFHELHQYCYRVAGTVGLMSIPIMGISNQSNSPTETILEAAVSMGIANQLTNILRDVGEDAKLGRIYLPQDELKEMGLSDKDVFASRVTNKWRIFMMNQINRTRSFYEKAELGISELSSSSRWPVWATLLLYRQILDAIEDNDYNNFTMRAYVNGRRKIFTLPVALAKTILMPS